MPQAPAKPRIGEPVSVDLLMPIGGEVSAADLLPPETPAVKPSDDDDDELSPWGLTKVAIGRVFSNLAKMPVDIVTLLNDVANDPRVRTMGPNGYGAAFAERLESDPAVRQARKAMDAAREGRTSEAIGHGIAAAVPIVGPMSADIGEQIGSGDPRQMAEATGDALTFAAPAGIARAARALPTRAATTPARVPMTRAERGGGGISKFAESLTERTVPGSGVFERFRATQQQALQGIADDVVTSVSRATGPAEQVGLAAQKALDEARKAMAARGGALFDEIDRLTNGVGVPTAPLKAAVQPIMERLTAESAVVPAAELARSRAIVERILSAPRMVSFRAMQDARSSLLAISRSLDATIPGKASGIARQVSKAADEAMMLAARVPRDLKTGRGVKPVTGLEDTIREANSIWRSMYETFDATLIKKLVDAAPEKVPSYIKSAELADIRLLASTVPAETMASVRASLIRDMLNKATSGELGRTGGLMDQYGITTHGRSPVQPRTLSGQSLRKQMEGIGEAKLETLFGKQATNDLLRLADEAERVTPRASGMVPGLLAGGVNAAIFSPILGLLGGPSLTVLKSAGTYALFNGIARMLVRQPRSRSVYNQFLSAMSRGDTQQALTAGLVLTRMMEQGGDEDDKPR